MTKMNKFFKYFMEVLLNYYKNLLDNKYFVFFQELILFIIGMIICSFFFSARFLKERLPQKIEFIYDDWLFLWLFASYTLFCILIAKKLRDKVIEDKPVRWYHKIGLKLVELYEKSLYSVYNMFIVKNEILQILLQTTTYDFFHKIYYKHYKKNLKPYIYIFFYFFVILPRMLVTICFFTDVLIFHKFFYLYKIIWVLIGPFLWRVFNYIIITYIDDRIKDVKMYYKIAIKFNDNYPVYIYTYKEDSNFVILNPLTKEEQIKILHELMPVYLTFLTIFECVLGSDGELKDNKLYKIISFFFVLIYAIIFGYYAIKLIDQELLLVYIIEYTKIMLDNILLFLPPLKVLKLIFLKI